MEKAIHFFFGLMPIILFLTIFCVAVAYNVGKTTRERVLLFLFYMTIFVGGYLWYYGIDAVAGMGEWELHRIST